MAEPARRRATYQDVLDAPPNVIAEVLYGVLHTHPRPAAPHTRAASKLGGTLDGPFDSGKGGPGGWILLDEPELHLGSEPDILVPDLAGWRRERLPRVPPDAYFTLVPDWACEVLSPSTQRIDRSDKMDIYAREGLPHLWLLDPLLRLLEVYRLQAGGWLRVGTWADNARVRAEPFDAVEIELSSFWI